VSERRKLAEVLSDVDRAYGGRGPTYSRGEQLAIHIGVVPEWLYRLARFHPKESWKLHCANLASQLLIARREFHLVAFAGETDEHDERTIQPRAAGRRF
jgi:hypothetical protein